MSLIEPRRDVQLTTPTTPRFGLPITPKSRVQVGVKLQITPRTPITPRSNTVYNRARQLFLRSGSSQLIGREKERSQLHTFLERGIITKGGRCLYVSGPPGTGKSAFVERLTGQLSGRDDVSIAYLNCMSIKDVQDVYTRLRTDLDGEDAPTKGEAVAALKRRFFSKSKKICIITLDEIDHLLSMDLSGLYTIFEWALNPKSNLILIGIANALDLTDRFLPRLKARNLQPELLSFAPYTVDQITAVVTSKLRSLLPEDSDPKQLPFLQPQAVKLLARKVTAQTGDLRKAFDIVRGALDLAEAKTKARLGLATPAASSSSPPLSENNNLSTPSRNRLPVTYSNAVLQLTATTAPCATVADVATVAAKVFNNGTTSRLKSLNLQQKAALCSLVSIEKQTLNRLKELAFDTPSKSTFARSTGVGVRNLFEMYKDLCTQENALSTLTRVEFGEVIDGLMEAGLVREASKGYGSGSARFRNVINVEKKVESAVTESELRASLDGVGGEILQGLLIDE